MKDKNGETGRDKENRVVAVWLDREKIRKAQRSLKRKRREALEESRAFQSPFLEDSEELDRIWRELEGLCDF